MKNYNYTFIDNINEDYFVVAVTKLGDVTYYKEVLIDSSVKSLVLSIGIRVDKAGYAYIKKAGYHPIHHIILNHISNTETVVDHINGNRLDNRIVNLRVLSTKDNANNRTTNSRCNTGVVGIARRSNGKYDYFRVSVSDRVTIIEGSKANSQTKRYTKQFNINKLGEYEAMTQAKAWLRQKRSEFGYV